jgi:hypothetical protein
MSWHPKRSVPVIAFCDTLIQALQMKISSASVKFTLTGFLAGVDAFFFLVVFDAVFCFFLGGMVMLSAKETTIADHLCATGEDRFHCVGSNLLLMKGDSFLFVLILVSFVKGDSTNRLLLLGFTAVLSSCCCCCCCLSSIE